MLPKQAPSQAAAPAGTANLSLNTAGIHSSPGIPKKELKLENSGTLINKVTHELWGGADVMGAIKKAHLGAAVQDSSCGDKGQWTPLLLQDFQSVTCCLQNLWHGQGS